MKKRKVALGVLALTSLITAPLMALDAEDASASANGVDLIGPLPPQTSELVDPQTPAKDGYVITASEEFNSSSFNSKLFSDVYLPHWSTSAGTKARYELNNGVLKLKIDQDQQPWDPKFDGSTRISSIQTFNKNYIHRWTSYPDVAQNVTPFRGHLQKYGYFEVKAKAAPGGGVHSAWWMIGANQDVGVGVNKDARESGEIDIFEILGRKGAKEALFSIHTWGDWFKLWPWRTNFSDGSDYSQAWHVYGFDWTPSGMDLYVDGVKVHHSNQSPSYPMMTLLGVYEKQEENSWTGPFDKDVPYPKTFEIDYFRAYQKAPTLPYSIEINDGYLRGTAVSEGGTTRWLGGVGNDATLNQVYVPADGVYELSLEYRSGEPRSVTVHVNDDQKIVLSKLSTGSFGGEFATEKFRVPMNRGWNTVRFSNDAGLAPDLGALTVQVAR
ncbi:hypothetical protein JOD55_000999 [Arcanobacterium pluranimalium]|uniref:family 16 glycosylhydrolase n=1 Tax=Arcanobacterium pluranimalium TaxID=108028 RepID=UPI00195A75AA|nr:family 16 glycosylhydrolase [Arcanobacterium pluranimalium]MBM7825172.1 hypothetical protein [Arcanobacterium pluranimalium]